MVLLAVCFTSQLQAQTTKCTPAQKAACKKICATTTVANCTPAQKAACQKVCDKSSSTKVVSNNPFDLPAAFVKNTTNEAKKTSCSSAKLTKNSMPSCTSKKSKVVKNEKIETAPIAQKVVVANSDDNE